MKIKKAQHQDRDMRKPLRIEWIVVIISAVLLSCCYLYTDLPFSTSRGLSFWDCVAEGKPALFYFSSYPGVEGSIMPNGSEGGSYDFIIYFIFALYNLPLWIWERLTGFRFLMFYPSRVYIKGIIWLFSGISARLIYKIAIECGTKKENAIWGPILFLSSGLFFLPIVTIGGYDIISVAFSLLGIYGYLKKNNKCFILAFSIAIASKLFALWLFIPLLLVKEKKIWKLILIVLLSLSVIILPKIYFAVGSKAQLAKDFRAEAVENKSTAMDETITASIGTEGNKIEEITEAAEQSVKVEQLPMVVNDVIAHSDVINDALFPTDYTAIYTFISLKNLPLVFVGMFFVWILCYLIKRELTGIEVIYLCTLVMSIFVLTVKIHPYWIILLAPYLILVIVLNPVRVKENLFLETVVSVGYVLNKVILYYWCFGMSQIENMLAPNYKFSYDAETVNTAEYGLERIFFKVCEIVGISEQNIAHTFGALFVVGMIMFLYFNFPRRINKKEEDIINGWETRKIMYWRFAFSLFVGCLPIVGLLMYLMPYNWGK